MVLDPIPQPLPVHFFGSRPQPPTSRAWRRALIWGAFTPCRHSFSPYKYPHTPHIFLHPTSHVQANVATAPPYNYVLTPYKYPHNPRPYSLHTYPHTLHTSSHPHIFSHPTSHVQANLAKAPVHGVGHSFGGALLCCAAAQRPDLFEKVCDVTHSCV